VSGRLSLDPRRFLELDSAEEFAEFERLKAAGVVRASALFDQRLAAGEPITVGRWQISGHGIPRDSPLFDGPEVWEFRVAADCTVTAKS
jgi:hypothetical protein